MTADEEIRTTRDEDAATEAAVLRAVLDLHPTRLSAAELLRELAGEEPEFARRDAIERAVHDLAGAGLLHRDGDFLSPTRAALRFSRLDC